MDSKWWSKRYFKQYNYSTSSYVTFSDTSDAQTKIGFGECWNTNSPTKTYELADAGQTLVVTHQFASEAEQTGFMSALATAWTDGSTFTGNTYTGTGESRTQVLQVRRVKTEWLYPDGSVSATTNFTY